MRSGVGLIVSELVVAAALIVATVAAGLAGRGAGGSGVNAWSFLPEPVGGAAEARCRYDLRRGPVRVTVEPWSGPLQVSVAAGGARVFAADQRSAPEGVEIVLTRRGQAAPPGARVVVSPTPEGEVVQRRLAPSPDRFSAAITARAGDRCEPAGLDFPAATG